MSKKRALETGVLPAAFVSSRKRNGRRLIRLWDIQQAGFVSLRSGIQLCRVIVRKVLDRQNSQCKRSDAEKDIRMQLRNHPLIRYRGVSSWPPAWVWIGGKKKPRPQGEVGILKGATTSIGGSDNGCFLYMEDGGATYLGCVFLESDVFYKQLVKIFQEHSGRSLREIGDIDLNHTL